MSQKQSNSQTIDPTNLSLVEFKILQETTRQPEIFDIESINEYDSKAGVKFAFNISSKLIKLEYEIELKTISENKEEAYAKYLFVLIYEYSKIDTLIKFVEKKLKVNERLGKVVFAVSHSTIRGVLLMKLSNTAFRDFILPIVNPAMDQFIKKVKSSEPKNP